MKTSATLFRRAAAGAAATAALVIGLSTVASAAPLGATTTGGPVATAVARATDPWSPDPVENDLLSQTSQGWRGDVPVGTVKTTTMTITAKQDLVLRPGNWYSGSDLFDFALSGRCPSSLFGSVRMAPGETCTVTWTMHPDDLVSLAAGWSFAATPVDAGGAATGDAVLGQHNLTYTATIFSAENVDFGEVVVGSSATKAVTFHNGSAVDAYLTVDAPWGDMTIPDRPVDPLLVPAGQDLTLDAVYTPTWPGTLTSSSWYRTTLAGSDARGTNIVRFSGSAVAAPTPPTVDPTDPPVDPTDPPTEPTDPPVDPTDPPTDPTDPPVDPTDASTDPEGPLVTPVDPTDPPVRPTDPPVSPSTATTPRTTTTPSSTAASPEASSAAPASGTGSGALASTGAPGLALALGALTLVCLGAAVRVWSRSRAVRDDARSAL